MRPRRWHLSLIVLALLAVSATLSFWLCTLLLHALGPWLNAPAPAMTRGEFGLILTCLAIVCGNWSGRR